MLDGDSFAKAGLGRRYDAEEMKIPTKPGRYTTTTFEIDGRTVESPRIFGSYGDIRQHHYIQFASEAFPKVNPHLAGQRWITDSAWKDCIHRLAHASKDKKYVRTAIAFVSIPSLPSLDFVHLSRALV